MEGANAPTIKFIPEKDIVLLGKKLFMNKMDLAKNPNSFIMGFVFVQKIPSLFLDNALFQMIRCIFQLNILDPFLILIVFVDLHQSIETMMELTII